MTKPTSNAALMNEKQGAADQRRSWKGEGGKERRVGLISIVLPAFSS